MCCLLRIPNVCLPASSRQAVSLASAQTCPKCAVPWASPKNCQIAPPLMCAFSLGLLKVCSQTDFSGMPQYCILLGIPNNWPNQAYCYVPFAVHTNVCTPASLRQPFFRSSLCIPNELAQIRLLVRRLLGILMFAPLLRCGRLWLRYLSQTHFFRTNPVKPTLLCVPFAALTNV